MGAAEGGVSLAARIIPIILCRGRTMVKGTQFNSWRSVGVAAQAVRIHQSRQCDEILLLDIGATPESRCPDLSLITELSTICFMPITAGGGVRSVDDVKALLRAGADKVAIGAAIHTQSGVIRQCADVVGSQAIVAVIETDQGRTYAAGKEWYTLSPEDLAIYLEAEGAGEILLMARDRDGTMEGYDLDTLAKVAEAVDIPVIAAGGCGEYAHMRQAIEAGADAVAAGAMFQWTDQTPRGAAQYLADKGIEVRI